MHEDSPSENFRLKTTSHSMSLKQYQTTTASVVLLVLYAVCVGYKE